MVEDLPNVRGSVGYGKTFSQMDNGFKREDSYKDIGTLLDWIKDNLIWTAIGSWLQAAVTAAS